MTMITTMTMMTMMTMKFTLLGEWRQVQLCFLANPLKLAKTVHHQNHHDVNFRSVVVCSHLGRPDGQRNMKFTLAPVAEELRKLLNKVGNNNCKDGSDGDSDGNEFHLL